MAELAEVARTTFETLPASRAISSISKRKDSPGAKSPTSCWSALAPLTCRNTLGTSSSSLTSRATPVPVFITSMSIVAESPPSISATAVCLTVNRGWVLMVRTDAWAANFTLATEPSSPSVSGTISMLMVAS